MRSRIVWATSIGAVLLVSGCATESKPDKQLTERQRDSIIATEKALPGSDVVGRALATSDSAAARAQRMDQQSGGDQSGGDASGGGK